MHITVLGTPYPPSVAPLKKLKKIMIRDLRFEINHQGNYLLLRFVCHATRMTSVINVVEDEAGTVCTFALYLQYSNSIRGAEKILKENSVIVLREPYFIVATSGEYLIRVDQPTDILWLSDDGSRIPAKWRKSNTNQQKPAEYWKKLGNDLVGKGGFFEAIEMYVTSR